MKTQRVWRVRLLALGLAAAQTATAQTAGVVETYDQIPPWILGSGTAEYPSEGGNPGAHARMYQPYIDDGSLFSYWNGWSEFFVGNYASSVAVTFGLDLKIERLSHASGLPLPVKLWVGVGNTERTAVVMYHLADMADGQDWRTLRVTWNPRSTVLPDGWLGFGASRPFMFEPGLPEGISFADVMANVGDIYLTTAERGTFTAPPSLGFDLRVDNLMIVHYGDVVFKGGFEGVERPDPGGI